MARRKSKADELPTRAPDRLGRIALERGPSRWDLDIEQWSPEELRHANALIRAEVQRRKDAGTWEGS